MIENNVNFQKYIFVWLMFSLGAAFFLSSHFLELFPQDTARWLLDASPFKLQGFNKHADLWFFLFLIVQLFLASVVLDKFSIQTLTAIVSGGLCISGIYFFANIDSHSFICLTFSRIFLVTSVAFVTVGYSKMVARVLPANLYGLMAGLFTTVALMGSVFGDLPTKDGWLTYTWQQMVICTGAGAVILAILFTTIQRDCNQLPALPAWRNLGDALRNVQNWLLAAYSGLSLAPLIILGGVAGRPFFEQTYHYNHHQLIELGAFLLLGLGVGGPLTGYLSGRMKRRRALMMVAILVQEVIFVPLIYLQLPFWVNAVLLTLFGLASSAFILSFAIAKEINQLKVIGVVSAIMNTGIIAVIAFTDPLFGKFLLWDWDGKIIGGLRFFSLYDYHVAFIIFPVYLLLGFILLLFVDEPLFW
jgi:hypothetical protein